MTASCRRRSSPSTTPRPPASPIVVAINKMDIPGANPDRIKQELTEYDLVPEEWGGDTIVCPISAKTGDGHREASRKCSLLQAEMHGAQGQPEPPARGTVIEARLDKGRGPIMTVLVQNGTLHTGDIIIAGTAVGRVRAMTNDQRPSASTKPAPPSRWRSPVCPKCPSAGDVFNAVADERMARALAEQRNAAQKKDAAAAGAGKKVSLEDLFARIQEGELKDFNIIVKADVQGSAEAVKTSLEKLSNEEVRVRVIHSGVGAINESDVMLASTSQRHHRRLQRPSGQRPRATAPSAPRCEIRMYRVIYDCINDDRGRHEGYARAEVPRSRSSATPRYARRSACPRSAPSCGCYVQDGKIAAQLQACASCRDNIVIFEGELASLRRFKDDVKEVAAGYECGMQVEKFNDIKEGDVIECFVNEQL